MRSLVFAITIIALVGATTDSAAQQQLAIPMTVKSIVKSPPKSGRLLKVSGYLVTEGKETTLQDTDSNRKVILDFSKSSVTLASLRASEASSPPVLIIGRMQGTKDIGKPTISVLGAMPLTP